MPLTKVSFTTPQEIPCRCILYASRLIEKFFEVKKSIFSSESKLDDKLLFALRSFSFFINFEAKILAIKLALRLKFVILENRLTQGTAAGADFIYRKVKVSDWCFTFMQTEENFSFHLSFLIFVLPEALCVQMFTFREL